MAVTIDRILQVNCGSAILLCGSVGMMMHVRLVLTILNSQREVFVVSVLFPHGRDERKELNLEQNTSSRCCGRS